MRCCKQLGENEKRCDLNASSSLSTSLGTPVRTELSNQPIIWQQITAFGHGGQKLKLLRFKVSIGEVVGARLRFPRTAFSGVYRARAEKDKITSEQQFSGRLCLIDARGQRTTADFGCNHSLQPKYTEQRL